jgi:hypothetical protein
VADARHRAAWLGLVLEAYARVCQLVGADVVAAEHGPAWALSLAASSAGHVDSVDPAVARARRVTSANRMTAAAVLREAEPFDDMTVIAVVEAAARWLDEPAGDEYAYALLGAVTAAATQGRAYGELAGGGAQ